MTTEQAIKKADQLHETMKFLAFETGAEIPTASEVFILLQERALKSGDIELAATYCRAYRQAKNLIDPINLHPEIPFS